MTGSALVPAFTVTCALLVFAGVSKVRSPQPARQAIRALGADVSATLVRGLGAAELGWGILATVRPGPVAAGGVALAYGAFCLVAFLLLRAGPSVDCGCFGQASSVASWAHVALNAIACGLAVAVALIRPPGLLWIHTRTPLVAVTLVIGMAAAAYAAYAVFTLFPPAWRAYGSAGEP
jgi:hypothetical protein